MAETYVAFTAITCFLCLASGFYAGRSHVIRAVTYLNWLVLDLCRGHQNDQLNYVVWLSLIDNLIFLIEFIYVTKEDRCSAFFPDTGNPLDNLAGSAANFYFHKLIPCKGNWIIMSI
jgi:hypothetical protein